MTIRVAINGFGRIGRLTLRALAQSGRNDIEVALINTPGDIATSAHLFEFDSTHGRFSGNLSYGEDWMDMGSGKIKMTQLRQPSDLPHKELGIDLVMECAGIFNKRDAAAAHLDAGASKVLLSAPADDSDLTVVYGVNHNQLTASHNIISNASCTTNCLAPVAKVMQDSFGIDSGYMTTIHAYTNDQNILDNRHKDLRRARSAGQSMVPTSTGAAKAVGLVLPELQGKLDGAAMRVPTANVSAVDFTFIAKTDVTEKEIHQALYDAANGPMAGVLGINQRPLVSIDFNQDPHSSIVDITQTQVLNKRFVRLLAWYDNEWGFSNRMLDTSVAMMRAA
ncbi:MAG: type I glyceraldehyde-3-phosphate dehydrogenase [Candidatus Puniceispirillaceae bacterium]